jgi:precorrin-6A synthase
MKRIFAIGIGSGGMDLLTVQAIEAFRQVDVFFIFDKGQEKGDLAKLRRDICARYCTDRPYRMVEIASPTRDVSGSYKSGVDAWHAERAALAGKVIDDALGDGQIGAFLVWGDPSLYDSTLRVLDAINSSSTRQLNYEVIPGISSVQVLAARHKIALNSIGEPVLVTTGRRIMEGVPAEFSSIVVFLDNGDGLRSLAGKQLDIYWGAYLGTRHEVLVAGPVGEVLDRILQLREEQRCEKGWIMDVYLLRRAVSS